MAYTLVPTELIVDGAITSAKLDTNITISGTLGVTGEVTLATHLIMGDNDKIKIGTGGDLEIYHDGSNSYISNSTGNIYLGDTNGSVHIQAKLNEESIICAADGAVTLYHDNSPKLATTSTGIDVTGTATMDGLTVDGTGDFNIGTENIGIDVTSTDAGSYIRFNDNNATGFYLGTNAANFMILDTGNILKLKIASNGDISFYEDTGTLAKLFWDASAEKLGIGTTSPSYSLDVSTSSVLTSRIQSSAGETILELDNTNTNGRRFMLISGGNSGSLAGGKFGVFDATAGATRLAIDSSGNVGIGTDSPSQILHVKDADYTRIQIEAGTTSHGAILNLGDSSDADYGSITQFASAAGEGGRMRFVAGATETMNLRGGNVGIGTSSPSSFYSGARQLVVGSGSGEQGITVYGGNAETSYLLFADGTSGAELYAGQVNYSHANNSLNFHTNGITTPRMTLDSSGKVSIGGSAISNAALTLENSANTKLVMRMSTATAGKYWRQEVDASNDLYIINNNSTGVYLGDGNTAFSATSDENLKENIVELTDVLDKVKDFRCVEYNLISDETNSKKIGFIAQDWQEDYSQVVSQDNNGNLGIQYTETIPVLLKAIQEQQTIIDDLKSRIETLEG